MSVNSLSKLKLSRLNQDNRVTIDKGGSNIIKSQDWLDSEEGREKRVEKLMEYAMAHMIHNEYPELKERIHELFAEFWKQSKEGNIVNGHSISINEFMAEKGYPRTFINVGKKEWK